MSSDFCEKSMSTSHSETRVKGGNVPVPSFRIEGRTVIITYRERLRIIGLQDEELLEGEPVGNAESFISKTKQT